MREPPMVEQKTSIKIWISTYSSCEDLSDASLKTTIVYGRIFLVVLAVLTEGI